MSQAKALDGENREQRRRTHKNKLSFQIHFSTSFTSLCLNGKVEIVSKQIEN